MLDNVLVKNFFFHLEAECEKVFHANALRHDHNTDSVLLDAWVLRTALDAAALQDKGFQAIGISEDELPLWKCFLPTVVERYALSFALHCISDDLYV